MEHCTDSWIIFNSFFLIVGLKYRNTERKEWYFSVFDNLMPEAEFLNATGTKVLRVFLLAIHRYPTNRFYSPTTPWAKEVWNWFVM
jgi:hypothetical protein